MHPFKSPDKVLEQHGKEKMHKNLQACMDQHRHFTPFVVSMDGLLGRETVFVLQKLSTLLAEKWSWPYSVVCGCIKKA
jgi:hypothetical protein